jgi:hypothetical protein
MDLRAFVNKFGPKISELKQKDGNDVSTSAAGLQQVQGDVESLLS